MNEGNDTPLHWRAALRMLTILPQGAISRFVGRLADIRVPRMFRNTVSRTTARMLGMDLSEAELPPQAYRSVGELFVRRLKPGARPHPSDDALLVSPVDGIVGIHGTIENGRLIQAKGHFYTSEELVDDSERAHALDRGSFVTIYLSPRHYHRIHSPCSGKICAARHVPGRLFPVNAPAIATIHKVFCRNERLISWIDGPFGSVAVAAIGAFNVGRISAAFDPEWTGRRGVTNRRDAVAETHTYEPAVPITQCDELMAFHLGSTIVMLIPNGNIRFDEGLLEGQEIRVGEPVAWKGDS
ncbi:MAG: phosphatidylserine decarboxylase [bacterium]|nr:phosphatidylserine decarboxylase [bacterium]